MHVPHRFLDMYEERELWMPFAYPVNKPYPGTPARGISTFTALCSLSVIMVCCLACSTADTQGRIISEIYKRHMSEPNVSSMQRIWARLSTWRDSLPEDIKLNPPENVGTPPPHVLSLQ